MPNSQASATAKCPSTGVGWRRAIATNEDRARSLLIGDTITCTNLLHSSTLDNHRNAHASPLPGIQDEVPRASGLPGGFVPLVLLSPMGKDQFQQVEGHGN